MSARSEFMDELAARAGPVTTVGNGRSLLQIREDTLIYLRYSKLHDLKRAFFGLRESDIRAMEGRRAFIALVWDGQPAPLLLPLEDFASVLRTVGPAGDGQYKVQVYLSGSGIELYIARAGRFNVAGHLGWNALLDSMSPRDGSPPELGHSDVQTLLAAIGHLRGLDVWVPLNDRPRLNWTLSTHFSTLGALPDALTAGARYAQQIDVIWVRPGARDAEALYEVEHSTPVYSGLLRFNDFVLSVRTTAPLTIVSNITRRDEFVRQVQRPTFRASGLHEQCAFMSYEDVHRWFLREAGRAGGE